MTDLEENQKLVSAYTGCLLGIYPFLLSLWSAIFGLRVADLLYKYLLPPGMWLAILTIVLSPLCFVKALRRGIGGSLVVASFLIGVVVIIVSLCAIGFHWGRTGVVISCFAGPGVVPMALVASLMNQDWWGAAIVGVGSVVILVSRILGLSLFFESFPSEATQHSLNS